MTMSDVLIKDESLIGLAHLMRRATSGADLGPLGTALIARAGADPRTANACALMDLSTVLQLRGNRELALEMQFQAVSLQQVYSVPSRDPRPACIRLLAVMGPGDLMANSPLELLLEELDVELNLVYVTPELDLPVVLPPHDVLFIAIAESRQNLILLEKIRRAVEHWPCPVLNRPERIARLSRDQNSALLSGISGVEMPATLILKRDVLQRISCGELMMPGVLGDGDFPVIVRPVDSHAGKGLEKLDDAAALGGYLAQMAQDEFYVSRFVDYRSADGQYRKYRIVLIEGAPYVCHMGISDHWMIHYLNAGMAESAEKRAEEAAFMARFDDEFALRHAGAFSAINQRAGLDYLGIDCAETADGRLLIFEIDSCMIVHAIDPVDIFPYKQPQMHKVFAAFRQMLLHAAAKN